MTGDAAYACDYEDISTHSPSPRNVLTLLDIDPLAMAEQMTIREHRIFSKVGLMDCARHARGVWAIEVKSIRQMHVSFDLVCL
jgi:hypothetical protein